MNQPQPYTYTDPSADKLIVGFVRMVTEEGPVDSVAVSVVNDPDTGTVYVPLPDVERVVAAIRTAAGAQQPEPEERRERYAAAIDGVGHIGAAFPAVLDAAIAVADEEQRELRKYEKHLRDQITNKQAKEIQRLRAELEQARTTAGQAAAPPTAEGEQEPETDEQREDREEVARLHAAGEHGDCTVECEVEMPSEHLRNFILAKGYPGTGGALDELLRRAGQARGTTGQDTTVQAAGEQEDPEFLHQDGKQRWRDRAEKAEAAVAAETATLRAERDALLAELGSRDDEARERWIAKQLDETGIRAMEFRNGAEMELEPARELVAHWVAAARTLLGDGPNYSETKLSMDVKVAESPETYTLVVQRHAPGALTPHEARGKAEAALADVLRIVSEVTIEANDVGGVDINDLVTRLGQAGHPLPDDETRP